MIAVFQVILYASVEVLSDPNGLLYAISCTIESTFNCLQQALLNIRYACCDSETFYPFVKYVMATAGRLSSATNIQPTFPWSYAGKSY
jgi:hypothetical protein